MDSKKYTCEEHLHLNKEEFVSPCRGKCKKCGLKKIHGYSNPDHVTNPFGYLFLIPDLCIECSVNNKLCAWCDYKRPYNKRL